MSYQEVSESSLLYVLVIVSLLIIAAICVYYLLLCMRKAKEMGISKQKVNEIIKSTAIFSIVPSIAIAIGLVTLVIVIGIPYAWFRLSVIGSVSYELMASNMALSALKLDLANADADAFGLIMWVMCVPITSTVLANIFVCKPMHLGTMRVGSGDKKWGALSQTTFMTALLVVLIVPMIFGGLVGLLTFVTSALIAVVVSMLAKKTGAKWMNDFILAICLIGAMGMSIVYTNLLRAGFRGTGDPPVPERQL